MTDPPNIKDFKGVFNQWISFEYYQKHGIVHEKALVSHQGHAAEHAIDEDSIGALSRSNSTAEGMTTTVTLAELPRSPRRASSAGSKTPVSSRPGTPKQSGETKKQSHAGQVTSHGSEEGHRRPYDYCLKDRSYQASDKALLAIFTQQKVAHFYQELASKAPEHDLSSLARSARIIERMMNQNVDDSVLIGMFFCSMAPGQVLFNQAGLGRGKVGGRGIGKSAAVQGLERETSFGDVHVPYLLATILIRQSMI